MEKTLVETISNLIAILEVFLPLHHQLQQLIPPQSLPILKSVQTLQRPILLQVQILL